MLPSVCALLLLTLVLFISVLMAWRRLGPRSALLANSNNSASPPAAALAHRISGLCAAMDDIRDANTHCETNLTREQQQLMAAARSGGCFLPPRTLLASGCAALAADANASMFNNYAVTAYLERAPLMCKEHLCSDAAPPPPPPEELAAMQQQQAGQTECIDTMRLPSPYASNPLDFSLLHKTDCCGESGCTHQSLTHRWNTCTALKPDGQLEHVPGCEHTYDVPMPPKWV